MRRRGAIVGLAGGLVLSAWAADEPPPGPARLANGQPVDGIVQKTNVEGLVIQTIKDVQPLPWKHLSAGTRYRSERTFLAQREADRVSAAKQAAAMAAAKAAATNAAAAPAAKTAATNVPAAPPKTK